MTSRGGDGGVFRETQQAGLAPVTYLPGAVPVDDEPVRWAIPLERAAGDIDDMEPSTMGGDDAPEGSSAEEA